MATGDYRTFSEAVRGPDEKIDLGRAALAIAHGEYPDLDVESYVARLDSLARICEERAGGEINPYRLIAAINTVLFKQEGFRGNRDDYYDPRNSFLNEVLDRKTGLPITLSVLYMEVGKRVGLSVQGVGFPGHFLVRYAGPDEKIIQILKRMLNNLKGIYLRRAEFGKGLSVVERLVILEPDSAQAIRDRGLLYLKLECFSQALEDLEAYLGMAGDAGDQGIIRERVVSLKKRVTQIH